MSGHRSVIGAGETAAWMLAGALVNDVRNAAANRNEAAAATGWMRHARRQQKRARSAEVVADAFADHGRRLLDQIEMLTTAVQERDREIAALRRHNGHLIRYIENHCPDE
ncbi:hypothetical protein [Afifella pfennigii]|uniref:hypothetical protein n=1 Tax=Afifella pfennigii TaxID=209897 RepID=UPI000550476C|nr:hypothetical protein [Afifella pfennigii]